MLEIKENISLKNYTTFHIGGPARYFVVANDLEELREALAFAKKNKLEFFILGGGSNILVSDQGFAGVVIKLNNSYVKIKNNTAEIGAGTALSKAIGETLGAGLLGLEWAAGIPGTVGGAVHNNAGAYGGEMSQSVKEVGVIRSEKIKRLKNKDCCFGYRTSFLKEASSSGKKNLDIIFLVILELKKAAAEAIEQAKATIRENIKKRDSKFNGFSAGSVFKNIELSESKIKEFKNKFSELSDQFVEYKKIPSAWLIDQCDLKGKTIGGAKVSEEHAGIIINTGQASAEDVIMLISFIKQQVRDKFGIQLQEEIEYIGF